MDVEEMINRACDYCHPNAAGPKDSREVFSLLQRRDRFETQVLDAWDQDGDNQLAAVLNALEILIRDERIRFLCGHMDCRQAEPAMDDGVSHR